MGVLSALLGVALIFGATQAGAAGSTTVLKFDDGSATVTALGFNESSNTPPPVGAQEVLALVIKNHGDQFGKPSGAAVGHVLIDCTVLNVTPQNADGVCSGIAHVPDGYFTFGGDGIFQNNAKPNHWAITGPVGPYANDRGQIVVTNYKNGRSLAVATLSP